MIDAERRLCSIAFMCEMLEISTSGYYRWRKHEPSYRARDDAALRHAIHQLFGASLGTYGVRRPRAGRLRPPRLWPSGVGSDPGGGCDLFSGKGRGAVSRHGHGFSVAPDLGWAMSIQQTVELIRDALREALQQRPGRSTPIIHHSDRDSQYASTEFSTYVRRKA